MILGLELVHSFQFGAQLAVLLSELLDEALLFVQLLLDALTARVDDLIPRGDLSNTICGCSSNLWANLSSNSISTYVCTVNAYSGFRARRRGQCGRLALEAQLLLELPLLLEQAVYSPAQLVHLRFSFCDTGYESCASQVGELHRNELNSSTPTNVELFEPFVFVLCFSARSDGTESATALRRRTSAC